MKWKKVFVEKEAWKDEVNMALTSLQLKRNKGVMFTTQFFAFDGTIITWMSFAAIAGFVLGLLVK